MDYRMTLASGSKTVLVLDAATPNSNDFAAAGCAAVVALFGNSSADNVSCSAFVNGKLSEEIFFYAEKG